MVFLDRKVGHGGVSHVDVDASRRGTGTAPGQRQVVLNQLDLVAAGGHQIELVQDNLPLPWSSAGSPSRRVNVYVRDAAMTDFPIQKDR